MTFKRSFRISGRLLLCLLLANWAEWSLLAKAGQVTPETLGKHDSVGWLIPQLTVKTVNEKSLVLRSLARSGQGLVVAFTSTTCPVSRQYGPTLARLEKELVKKGLKLVLVNPTATDSVDSIKTFLANFPNDQSYIHDRDESIAKAFRARSTTEVFLVDKAGTVRYRGAVDDQFGVGTALEKPRHDWLMTACKMMLDHTDIATTMTDPSGCVLDHHGQKLAQIEAVTYHNRISRIVQKSCLNCHHTDGLAPFSLETLDDVKAHKAMIRKEVERGQMPPWFADKSTMANHPGWSNDCSMPAQDKRDLLAWLGSELMPEGDIADAPLPRKFATTGWQIGTPDMVYKLPAPIEIPAQGKMPYQHRTIDMKLSEETWIQAVEIRPTDKSVVHHVLVFVAPPESDADQDENTEQENRGFFAAYVPGTSAMIFPENYGKRLTKGSRLRFQIHYTPNGQKTTDQLEIGLLKAVRKPAHEIKVIGISNPNIKIPAGAGNHVEVARQTVPTDINLLSFVPHTHVRGKAFKYEIVFPDKRRETVLDVPRYDFNWQLRYQLAKPIAVPKGSVIIATATYDNSDANKANPDPTKTVYWGQQTDEEMMLGYTEYEVTGPKAEFQSQVAGPLAALIGGKTPAERRERFFNLMDKNKDNALTIDEMQMLKNLVPRLRDDPERMNTVFKTLDTNDDGKLSRDEMKSIRNLSGG